jgi:hypothetical protein
MTPTEFTLQQPPNVVGFYWVGGVGTGVGFPLTRKPWWLHRVAMCWIFGWEWRDV